MLRPCYFQLFFLVQCCFTSTETIRTIRDEEPRTVTSTFTQLLNSFVLVFLLLRDSNCVSVFAGVK